MLPVNRSVRFEITSLDVLHSFWVPGFLMKIDAVPGRTTLMSLTPTRTGSFQTDPNLRVQCAELCGIAHARMRIPVRVVSDEEFDDWVAEQAGNAAAPSDGAEAEEDAQEFTIVGEKIQFDTDEMVAGKYPKSASGQVLVRFCSMRPAGEPSCLTSTLNVSTPAS